MSSLGTVEGDVAAHQLTVTVVYNGLPKPFSEPPTATVKALLDKALHGFSISDRPHTFALFTEDGRELPDAMSLHDAGVKDHETLLLRPSAVRGGGC